MTKHKKKSPPKKPDPKDSENKDLPPIEPVVSENEKTITDRKTDILFWLRIAFAVIGGIVATFVFEPIEGEDRRWASIFFMIAIFIVSIGIAKGMRIQFPPSDRKKIITTGIGSFVFIYLFIWILTYTIVHTSDSGIPMTPFT